MRDTDSVLPHEVIEYLEFYARFLQDNGLACKYQGRKIVYDGIRKSLGAWEASNTRLIKELLDAEDFNYAGRDTSGDWLSDCQNGDTK